jgi:hypothetical protein
MSDIKNWRHGKYVPMKLLWCTATSQSAWGNPTKPATFRCTKCGKEHG